MPFSGFPSSGEATAVPRLFFSQLLPSISRVEELLVSLYFFYAQGRIKGRSPHFLTTSELAAETTLIRALANFCDDAQAALKGGLALSAERGTLLKIEMEADGKSQAAYLLNSPSRRRALAGLSQVRLEEPLPPAEPLGATTIFALYEENIGALTPLIVDELKDAEERYPWPWLQAAFREAAAMNKRSWRYIQAVLKRWETEGPDYETTGRDTQESTGGRGSKRPLSGRYRYLVRR